MLIAADWKLKLNLENKLVRITEQLFSLRVYCFLVAFTSSCAEQMERHFL